MIHSVQSALTVVQGAPKTVAAATRSPKIMVGLYHTNVPPQQARESSFVHGKALVSGLLGERVVLLLLEQPHTEEEICESSPASLPLYRMTTTITDVEAFFETKVP